MAELVLCKSNGFDWLSVENIIFKGIILYKGQSYNSNDRNSGLKFEILNDILKNIEKISGNFIIIKRNRENILVYTDVVRSFPLYYSEIDNKVIIADAINSILLRKEIQLSEWPQKEFFLTGFVTGKGTMVEDVFSVPASSVCTFGENPNDIMCHEYHTYAYNHESDIDVVEVKRQYEKVFNDVRDVVKGRTVVVPLSGGYDSRLIIEQLYKLAIKDVICFTYGIPGNKEAVISKEVADFYGYPWIFIEYNKEKWQDDSIQKYIEETFDYVSLPHIQDFIAVKELKNRGLIPQNSIFIPGHSGDFIAGSHLHKRLIDCQQEDAFKFEILWKHYKLNPTFRIQTTLTHVLDHEKIEDKSLSYPNRYEKWGLRERQSKFIVNSARVYEYFDFEWYMPLWDMRLVNFWLSVPVGEKINRTLYFKYISQHDPWYSPSIKKNVVPSLSKSKYYVNWLLRCFRNWKERTQKRNPMGWYYLISRKTNLKSFGFYESINGLLVRELIETVRGKIERRN